MRVVEGFLVLAEFQGRRCPIGEERGLVGCEADGLGVVRPGLGDLTLAKASVAQLLLLPGCRCFCVPALGSCQLVSFWVWGVRCRV